MDIEGAIIASGLRVADEPEKVVDIVDAVLRTCEDEEKERKKKTFVYTKVLNAATELQSAVTTLDEFMVKEGVEKQLESIEGSVTIIRGWLGK